MLQALSHMRHHEHNNRHTLCCLQTKWHCVTNIHCKKKKRGGVWVYVYICVFVCFKAKQRRRLTFGTQKDLHNVLQHTEYEGCVLESQYLQCWKKRKNKISTVVFLKWKFVIGLSNTGTHGFYILESQLSLMNDETFDGRIPHDAAWNIRRSAAQTESSGSQLQECDRSHRTGSQGLHCHPLRKGVGSGYD